MAARRTLTFVTGNLKKLMEFRAVVGIDDIAHRKIDLEEIQGSIKNISLAKAKAAARVVKGPVLVEDTCLVLNALSKPGIELPGPYVKWFVDAMGSEGVPKLLAGFEDKSAQSVCTFTYCASPNHEPILFQGVVSGTIIDTPRTKPGRALFGYDPIFVPDGHSQTYAEMDQDFKNSISDRSKAARLVKEFLNSQLS